MGRQRLDESPDADIFQKVAYELDTRGGETYFNGSKATQITLEMMGKTK